MIEDRTAVWYWLTCCFQFWGGGGGGRGGYSHCMGYRERGHFLGGRLLIGTGTFLRSIL